MTDRAKMILGTIEDLVADFLYYDRLDNDDLCEGEIEEPVVDGEVTVDQMVEEFSRSLKEGLDG